MTITTVGFGDLAMETTWERLYAIFIMMSGACLFAYMMSNFAQVLTA